MAEADRCQYRKSSAAGLLPVHDRLSHGNTFPAFARRSSTLGFVNRIRSDTYRPRRGTATPLGASDLCRFGRWAKLNTVIWCVRRRPVVLELDGLHHFFNHTAKRHAHAQA
jgi:hypothetical protein